MKAWYAVHTKPRQETVASEHLSRQGFETHAPVILAPRRRRGRWSEVVQPLFPGYLFVRLDLEHQNTAPIRSTRGVTGLVRFGGLPTPVPQGVVERLVAAGTACEGAVRLEYLFQPGDRVEIVSGALAGLEAVFLAASGQERVRVLLEMLGRENRVLLSRHQLVPAT
jgi:transcriptional antiterminator RfaH